MKKKFIVSFGGGTGQPVLLRGLRKICDRRCDIEIIAVASTIDSGGSTRRLRDERGMLPPSDIWRCILALSDYDDEERIRKLLLHRIKGICPELNGHTIGNHLLTSLTKHSNYIQAVKAVSRWLKIKGTVLPITLSDVHLIGITKSGKVYSDEASIGTRNDCEPFAKIFLSPAAKPFPKVLEVIKKADAIIFGPGDLLTSQLPHLLVDEIAMTIANSLAIKICVINITTRYAETHKFTASDHVLFLEKYLGCKVDHVICNSGSISRRVVDEYKKEKSYPVKVDITQEWGGRKVISANLLKEGGFARHDSNKLATLIATILFNHPTP